MFLSLSKAMVRFGKLRLGLGIRITKKNVIYMGIVLMFVYIMQACWALMVLCFWLAYAVCYGMYWCIKKLINSIRNKAIKKKGL